MNEPTPHRFQLTPDLALVLDESLCIVAEVSIPRMSGRIVRRVTITNVEAFKDALDVLRAAQGAEILESEQANA
jgi:hypothetical protein